MLASTNAFFNSLFVARNQRFDGAVQTISYPAREAETARGENQPIAKTDALDPAAYLQLLRDHYLVTE